MKQEMMGWQWHQLDHMQIIYTSLRTNNHASTSPLSFHRPDAFPCNQLTVSKHWRHYFAKSSLMYISATKKILPVVKHF